MNVTIRTIDKILFSDAAQEITLPGLYGKVGIRPNHAPMSVVLSEGEIQIKLSSGNKTFSIENGLAQVGDNAVNVLLAC
jgi:F0F1-type ATP synthase epsilon subunit